MGSKRIADEPLRYYDQDSKEASDIQKATVNSPSLKTLIKWNISKALKNNPGIDLKAALQEAQQRLEEAQDVKTLVATDTRNLCCAFLAWQQLGHRSADSLYNFVEESLNEEYKCQQKEESLRQSISYGSNKSGCSDVSSLNELESKKTSHSRCQWGSPTPPMDVRDSIGLVVKLPVEAQTVMQLSGSIRVPTQPKKCCSEGRKTTDHATNKINFPCCLDKACMERLTSMEAETKELRMRAAQFARRETLITEQLERAEMAWRDLDACFQRRLRLAKEKEQDYEKQTARCLEQRNRYKQACMPLVEALKMKSALAEKEQETLNMIGKVPVPWIVDFEAAFAKLKELVCNAPVLKLRPSPWWCRWTPARWRWAPRSCSRAREELFWSGITRDTEQYMRRCEACQECQNATDELQLIVVETCSKACARVQLSERAARADTQLTEQQVKASQLDRNLALQEEQERRKQRAMASAVEAAQVLTHEAEYAQRTELQALRDQVARASQDLLEEDARTEILRQRIGEYMQEKDELIEDLEGCQAKCDGRMEALVKDLKLKKDQVAELEKQILECLCKDPVDRAVEAKRSPSLAALCRCSPSGMIEGTCSCTSVRSRLLTSLLRDLFGGLKSEMEFTGSQMPCHLLKCLEDKHNWDRTTEVKQNVRAYFSRLLLGELDIAIATVIEKSHAQWVGECCADIKTLEPRQSSRHSLRWQEHALEAKTQKIASEMAEKMFKEKAKELARQAEEELAKNGHPPCECDLSDLNTQQYSSAVFRCLVHPYPDRHLDKTKTQPLGVPCRVERKDNHKPQVTEMRPMKRDANGTAAKLPNSYHQTERSKRKKINNSRPELIWKNNGNAFQPATNRRISDVTAKKLKTVTNKTTKEDIKGRDKVLKGRQQFAVNMCFCDNKKYIFSKKSHKNVDIESEIPRDRKFVSSFRQQKPTTCNVPQKNSVQDVKKSVLSLCTERCSCLHREPSNTSVDRLVSILSKWKDNLVESQDCNIKEALNSDSLFKITHASIVNIYYELRDQTDKMKHQNSVTGIKKSGIIEDVKPSQDRKNTLDEENTFSKNRVPFQIQGKRSRLLTTINFDESLCKCDDSLENCEPNATQNQTHKTSFAKSVSDKVPLQQVSFENYLPVNSITIHDNSVRTVTEINKNNNVETELVKKLPVINVESSAVRGENCIQCLGATLANANYDPSLSKNDKLIDDSYEKAYYGNNNCNIFNNQYDINEIGDVAKFSKSKSNNNCENNIRFLGVAFDKASILPQQYTKRKRIQNNNKRHHKYHLCKDKRRNNHDKSDDQLLKLNAKKDLRKIKIAIKKIEELNTLQVHNQYVSAKSTFENLNDCKSVEIHNISNEIINSEPCVCCPTSHEENSNDLEVNAFQLLEEYLKCKFDEFKHTACKSSCIQNEEEKSILGDTLRKVKKLIREKANKVTCKCVGNNKSSGGSWNRAYSLLQEYLKTKIEHVKCLCSSADYGQDENSVPKVLSQISCLVNNDLLRLKAICKCNETTLDTIRKGGSNCKCVDEGKNCNNLIMQNSIDHNNLSTSEIIDSKFVTYTDCVILPHNKSAQVLLCKSVDTKSCDALKTYSKYSEVQTVAGMETKLLKDNFDCGFNSRQNEGNNESIKTELESNFNTDIEKNGFSTDITNFQRRDIIVLSQGDKINENDAKDNTLLVRDQLLCKNELANSVNDDIKIDNTFFGYIGCTINCCCDRDIGCVCSKSTALKNSEWVKLNNVWKTFSRKQDAIEKFPYILNSIPHRVPKKIDCVENNMEKVYVTDIPQRYQNQHNSDIRLNVEKNIHSDGYIQKVHKVNEYYKSNFHQVTKTKQCESEVCANEEKHIHLKKSKQKFDIFDCTANNSKDLKNCLFKSPNTSQYGILKRNKNELLKRASVTLRNSGMPLGTDHASKKRESLCTDCDCIMVPLCHVKMLVENIGNKLVKEECTCDSVKSVCPIHS